MKPTFGIPTSKDNLMYFNRNDNNNSNLKFANNNCQKMSVS